MSKSKLFTFLLIFLSFSAIFSFYHFDSAYAQGVIWTYNADTNTATASGSGSTNFAALVAADTAGGWGVYTADASGTQINCAGKIVVGDGTNACVFSDSNKQVYAFGFIDSDETWLTISDSSTLTLGELTDATNKTTRYGCVIYVYYDNAYSGIRITGHSEATVNLFSCLITGKPNRVDISYIYGKVYNCQFNRCSISYFSGDWYNSIGSTNSFYLGFIRDIVSGSTLDRIEVFDDSASAIACGYNALTITNAKIRNCAYAFYKYTHATSDVGNLYAVDCDVDHWNILWGGTKAYGWIYRQYSFNLNVLNGNITDFVQNANVTLYKDNVKIYSALTNSSGMIPTQRLTYGYYQQATGNNIQNATSPYYLVITHPDWQTYISRFYITEPLRLTVSMQEPTYTGYTEAEKSDYTTIILFVISLILCIIGLALTVPLLPLISLTISVINIIFLSEPSIFNILLIVLNVIFTIIALVRVKTKNN